MITYFQRVFQFSVGAFSSLRCLFQDHLNLVLADFLEN